MEGLIASIVIMFNKIPNVIGIYQMIKLMLIIAFLAEYMEQRPQIYVYMYINHSKVICKSSNS